jgi:protoporphyrinogen oxidase
MVSKKSDRIAIIGGGLTGLVVADGLRRKGYEQITVFEKENRIGGKLNTIQYKGKSYEFGALFSLPRQKHLKQMIKSFHIKTDGPRISRTYCDVEGNRRMQIPKEDLAKFLEEMDRLFEVLNRYPSLEKAIIDHVEPDLMLPFSRWCEINQFRVLKTVYAHYFTSYGLGFVEDTPALYVLRILNYDNLMSFMELPEFSTWKDGSSTLIESLQREVKELRLGQKVTKILSKEGKVTVYTAFESLEFDQVVITAPLDQFADFFADDKEMQGFIGRIQYQDFSVYAVRVDNSIKGCGCVVENLSKERRGHVGLWYSRWDISDGDGLVMAYVSNHPKNTSVESFERVKSDLLQLGFHNPRLYQVRRWKQSPFVSTSILQKGFYDRLKAMQGKGNVYFAGEIMSTISMDNCIGYANELLKMYF